MVRKMLMNGKLCTMLVFEDSSEDFAVNPILEILKDQAERVENLENMHKELAMREDLIADLMEMNIQAGKLMSKNIEALRRLEESLSAVSDSEES